MITLGNDIDELASFCLNRHSDTLFTLDRSSESTFSKRVAGSRILITGAAGFIAQATLPYIFAARPESVVLLDSSENALTQLARMLNSGSHIARDIAVRYSFVDVTSPLLTRAIQSMGPFDLVLHYAAAKHVRSERDVTSALRILEVNVLGTHQLVNTLEELTDKPQLFLMSTDKVTAPTSVMGASKGLAERIVSAYSGRVTVARFANVLFSHGSISESWIDRLRSGHALSVPTDTYRYFISPQESGRICANSLAAPVNTVVIPEPGRLQSVSLNLVIERFLNFFDLKPAEVSLEAWRTDPASIDPAYFPAGLYPVVITPRDTVGDKRSESFVAEMESFSSWQHDLATVKLTSDPHIHRVIEVLTPLVRNPKRPLSLADLQRHIMSLLPGFQPHDGTALLDDRI